MKLAAVSGLLILCLLIGNAVFVPKQSRINEVIALEYGHVKQLSADQFTQFDLNKVIVFDVREKNEFAVSRLSNAVQLEPDMTSAEFELLYADRVQNKTVVFYCSVGRRSSKLAAELEDVLEDSGAKASYNLEGGVFQWRNENRPLFNANREATEKVHPFNAYWGRLIKDRSAIKYQ